jgi:tetratricopeptide (TPR) repeat protein
MATRSKAGASRAPSRAAPEPSWARRVLPVGALFLVVAAVYAPSARNAFIYDDEHVVVKARAPRTAADFARIFVERHFFNLPYYRPVTRLTLLAQKTLYGNDPAPFHLANALLMAAAAVAAYGLLRRPVFGIERTPALAAAALFALHPIASSCVYPVSSGRETLLPSFWTLVAVWALLHAGARWYAAAFTAAVLALLSKEQSVVVPALFACADLAGLTPDPPGRSLRRWLVRYAPFLPLAALYFAVRQHLFGGIEYAPGNPLGPVLALGYALQTLVAPFAGLVYEPTVAVWFSPIRLGAALVAVAALVLLARRTGVARERPTLFWLVWFGLALLPTANLIRQEAPFDERYVFLASFAFLALAARIVWAAWPSAPARRGVAAVAALLAVVGAGISAGRAAYFRDDVAFSRQWLLTNPESINAHYNLAYALAPRGDLDEAIAHYRAALRIRPDYTFARNNLGNALAARGETAAAIAEFREALRLDPAYADAHHNLGLALAGQGKLEEAERELAEAVRLEPGSAEARNNLGNALAAQGQVDAAITQFSEAVRLRPDFAAAHNNLGNALARTGRLQDAVTQYSAALRLQPDYPEARRNLELVLGEIRSGRDK